METPAFLLMKLSALKNFLGKTGSVNILMVRFCGTWSSPVLHLYHRIEYTFLISLYVLDVCWPLCIFVHYVHV